MRGETGMTSIIIITYFEPICTQSYTDYLIVEVVSSNIYLHSEEPSIPNIAHLASN